MDTNMNFDTDNSLGNIFNINVDDDARDNLKKIASWARILSIVGFIGSGVSLVQTIVTGSRLGVLIAVTASATTLVFVVVSVIMNIFLLKFSNQMNTSLSTMNQGHFDQAINSLRIYFKVMGIVIIVIISLVILVILISMFAALIR